MKDDRQLRPCKKEKTRAEKPKAKAEAYAHKSDRAAGATENTSAESETEIDQEGGLVSPDVDSEAVEAIEKDVVMVTSPQDSANASEHELSPPTIEPQTVKPEAPDCGDDKLLSVTRDENISKSPSVHEEEVQDISHEDLEVTKEPSSARDSSEELPHGAATESVPSQEPSPSPAIENITNEIHFLPPPTDRDDVGTEDT
eukprot:gene3-11476_t